MSIGTNDRTRSLIPLPLVGFGGAVGTMARYELLRLDWSDSVVLLMINVVGSVVLGALSGVLFGREGEVVPARWLALVGVGLCGGFTTFSGHMLEVASHLDEGQWEHAFSSLLGTTALCVGGAIIGFTALRPASERTPR